MPKTAIDLVKQIRLNQLKQGYTIEYDLCHNTVEQLQDTAIALVTGKHEKLPASFDNEKGDRLLSLPAQQRLLEAAALLIAQYDYNNAIADMHNDNSMEYPN